MDKHFEQNKEMVNNLPENIVEIRRAYYNESNGLSLNAMFTKYSGVSDYFNDPFSWSFKNDIEENLKQYLTGDSYVYISKNVVHFRAMKRDFIDGQPYDIYDKEKKIYE